MPILTMEECFPQMHDEDNLPSFNQAAGPDDEAYQQIFGKDSEVEGHETFDFD